MPNFSMDVIYPKLEKIVEDHGKVKDSEYDQHGPPHEIPPDEGLLDVPATRTRHASVRASPA